VLNSTEPDVSGLVLAAMAEFVGEPNQLPAPDVDLLQVAATGATEGVGATTPTLIPAGVAGLGLVIGLITRRRHRRQMSRINAGRR
jgi:hypothetical protein